MSGSNEQRSGHHSDDNQDFRRIKHVVERRHPGLKHGDRQSINGKTYLGVAARAKAEPQ